MATSGYTFFLGETELTTISVWSEETFRLTFHADGKVMLSFQSSQEELASMLTVMFHDVQILILIMIID